MASFHLPPYINHSGAAKYSLSAQPSSFPGLFIPTTHFHIAVLVMMRSFLFLATIAPLVIACNSPKTDGCASAFTASSSDAAAFCARYTTAPVTQTTDLPAYAKYCSMKPKKLSSVCSCLVVRTTLQTVAANYSSTTAAKVTSATGAAGGDGTACTATEYAQITSVVKSCTNIVLDNISAPASSTIDLIALQTGSTVTFSGTTSFDTTSNDNFDPIVIGGTDITITGADGHVIDGNGAAYWDGKGSNDGVAKPDHFIVLKDITNGHISNLNVQNWPVHCFDITGADGLTITGLTLDNSAGDASNSASDGKAAAHNSDGFDISGSTNVVLANTVVKNQDDCVAVTSGTNITVTGMTCSGGHGLSIGSVGGKSDNSVSGITFSDSTITDSENGCRIKSNAGKTGTIENIVYQNIVLSGITDYGIDVQQNYLNGGATGDPTNGVTISGVTFSNVTGTVTSYGTNYYVLCGSSSCSDFKFTNVAITGGGTASTCNFPSTGCLS